MTSYDLDYGRGCVRIMRVLVVGGGASGLLVAVNLLRKSKDCAVTIIEPSEKLGLGVAYSTIDPDHLLNVPAGRMSGLVEEPKSLCQWAGVGENDFVSRQQYGSYLNFLLSREIKSGNRFEHVRSRVIDLSELAEGFSCKLENGEVLQGDSIVLALGNSESILPTMFDDLPMSKRVIRDVWREGLATEFDSVAVIGTGLTFYDIALSILRDRPSAVVHGISRNGLLPLPHLRHRAPALDAPESARRSAKGIRDYLTSMGDKWREAQDGIRHDLQVIWSNFPDSEKKAFINEHFRWWNSLRHRSAPEIDERISEAISLGRIVIHKAGVDSIEDRGNSLLLSLSNGKSLEVEQVINCCGNQFFATHPLFETLEKKGMLARGPLNYGVACDVRTLALKDKEGNVHKKIFGIGPILVGELLETTAIPEIKSEAELIARQLTSL